MITPNFDKQAEKLLITPVRNWKISIKLQTSLVMMSQTSYWEWITYHFILKINHKQIVPEIQFSTEQYFCEVVPNAAVFIVVFQVHVDYFILN